MGVIIVLLGFISFCLFYDLFEGIRYRTIGYLCDVSISAFFLFMGFLWISYKEISNGMSDTTFSLYLVIIVVLILLYENFKHKLHV